MPTTTCISRRTLLAGLAGASLGAAALAGCAGKPAPEPPTPTVAPTTPASPSATAAPAPLKVTVEPTAASSPASESPDHASGVVATPSAGVTQFRAFWADAFKPGFKTPDQVDQLLQDARQAGANAVFVQVRRRGDAYFNRSVEPRTEDPDLAPGFDVLDDLLTKARTGGPPIQVHAWVASLPIWRNGPAPRDPAHVFNQHGPSATGRDNWLSWNHAGKQFDGANYALDPGHPDAADYTTRVMTDLARQYPVDGIHLDYIRYAQSDWGYNPVNVERFNRQLGRSETPAASDPAWCDWRRAQVTALVRRIYLELQRIRPSTQLSGALIPWGRGPADEAAWLKSPPYAWTFQDWHAWLAEGIVDLGVPMAYFREGDQRYLGAFDEWTRDALAHQGRRRVAMGVGIFTNTVADSIGQIERAIASGATGLALYSYATVSRDPNAPRASLIDALTSNGRTSGPFAQPADVPILPWKSGAPEAHLYGRALDAAGRPLDGAKVALTGPENRDLIADGSGYFGAVALAPGDYTVTLSLAQGATPAKATVQVGKVAELQVTAG